MVEVAFERADGAACSCPHCGRPFTRAEYRTLHVGLDHPETLSPEERERFQTAYLGETGEIKRFRLKALALLVVLYFTFLFVYLLVT